jgi:hypothetical protein
MNHEVTRFSSDGMTIANRVGQYSLEAVSTFAVQLSHRMCVTQDAWEDVLLVQVADWSW